MLRFFAVILVLALSNTAIAHDKASTPLGADINKQQLVALQQSSEDFLLLDVRSKKEFEQSHIPGAINIPHDELGNNLAQIKHFKDKNIVVYCRSGRRAGIAIELLKEKEFNHLSHLEGDMLGWAASEIPHKSH